MIKNNKFDKFQSGSLSHLVSYEKQISPKKKRINPDLVDKSLNPNLFSETDLKNLEKKFKIKHVSP